jgi:hypothetical protein
MAKGVEVHGIPAKHEQFNKMRKRAIPFKLCIDDGRDDSVSRRRYYTVSGPGRKGIPFLGRRSFFTINGRDEFRHALEFEGNFRCEEAVGWTGNQGETDSADAL